MIGERRFNIFYKSILSKKTSYVVHHRLNDSLNKIDLFRESSYFEIKEIKFMKEKIKKILIFIVIIIGFFVVYNYSLAHPGNTASDGCHYCRTNCTSWGVAWNQRHCHGGGSYSPNYDFPSYDYPSYTPSIPDCPFNSYYDSISGSCKCYSGYVVSNGECISTSQWCQDKYGLWAMHDYLTDSCKCNYGYVFGKDFLGKTTCISTYQYCQDSLGYNAKYNILTDSCECSYGYVLSGGKCINGDTLCHQKYGYNSSYNSLTDKCKCNYGYVFDSNDQCVSEDNYCQDLYGYYSEYNSLTDKCTCKSGYVFDSLMTKCIEGDSYCRNKYGDNINYDSLTKICVCDYGYKFVNNECVTPEIFRIYPLEIEAEGEVTIQGENFGDSKYDDLKLYIGFVKVNTLDISRWQDDKIIFKIADYLESGYVSLKGDFVNIRGSYLEISEPEEIPSIYYLVPETIEPVSELNTDLSQDSEVKIELQSGSESKSESLQPVQIEPQPEDSQQLENEKKQEKEELKNSPWIFLANILNTIKEFFGQFFR